MPQVQSQPPPSQQYASSPQPNRLPPSNMPPAGFYGMPPGAGGKVSVLPPLRGSGPPQQGYGAGPIPDNSELTGGTSADTTKGITKDSAGLPVSSTTKGGAHLLTAVARAKGPGRRPPSAMIRD